MMCRHCGSALTLPFADLGCPPPSNAYLCAEQLSFPETTYPLEVRVCDQCWLVQTIDFARADELFSPDYAYFSSTSKSWLRHAQEFSEMAIERFGLGRDSQVIELASNDGYLLKNFLNAEIPCLGVEPTANTSAAAAHLGIPQYCKFFDDRLAKQLVQEGKTADLVVANNVLAHVPDINDFCAGIAKILKPNGVVSIEFPHLLNLIEHKQFDTIYHEHFSYLSLGSVRRILAMQDLEIFDVTTLTTHGGSLRVFATHCGKRKISPAVDKTLAREESGGLSSPQTYLGFQSEIEQIKNGFLDFLINAKADGKSIAAYGAAAKGNTLLNFAGVTSDLVSFVVDAAPSKQGKYLPGSHIPILSPHALQNAAPEILLILPWNIASEIAEQNRSLRSQGTQMYVVTPEISLV